MSALEEWINEDGDLRAVCRIEDEIPVVSFFKNNRLIRELEMPNKTWRYAMDACENWVEGRYSERALLSH